MVAKAPRVYPIKKVKYSNPSPQQEWGWQRNFLKFKLAGLLGSLGCAQERGKEVITESELHILAQVSAGLRDVLDVWMESSKESRANYLERRKKHGTDEGSEMG
jgi:hypothetical protein